MTGKKMMEGSDCGKEVFLGLSMFGNDRLLENDRQTTPCASWPKLKRRVAHALRDVQRGVRGARKGLDSSSDLFGY